VQAPWPSLAALVRLAARLCRRRHPAGGRPPRTCAQAGRVQQSRRVSPPPKRSGRPAPTETSASPNTCEPYPVRSAHPGQRAHGGPPAGTWCSRPPVCPRPAGTEALPGRRVHDDAAADVAGPRIAHLLACSSWPSIGVPRYSQAEVLEQYLLLQDVLECPFHPCSVPYRAALTTGCGQSGLDGSPHVLVALVVRTGAR